LDALSNPSSTEPQAWLNPASKTSSQCLPRRLIPCQTLPTPLSQRKGTETNRLVVSQVSRALLDSYGGSLTYTEFRNFAGNAVDNLAGLMRRDQKLVDVTAEGLAIPALCQQ